MSEASSACFIRGLLEHRTGATGGLPRVRVPPQPANVCGAHGGSNIDWLRHMGWTVVIVRIPLPLSVDY